MIGRLTGIVVEDAADGSAVIDVAGVGYDVTTPLGTLGRVAVANGAVTLFVHTHVREDALQLYAFATSEDRETFRTLIGISNIGPKIALAILGTLSAADLAEAVARADVGRLTKIPGVGKRTAERIVLELKGKLVATTKTSGAPTARPASTKSELLARSLTGLGFKPAESERAAAALGDRLEAEPLEALVRAALALLAR